MDAQPLFGMTFHLRKRCRAVPIMEIPCPAAQHCIHLLHDFTDGLPGPVPPGQLRQPLFQLVYRFGRGLHMRIPNLYRASNVLTLDEMPGWR